MTGYDLKIEPQSPHLRGILCGSVHLCKDHVFRMMRLIFIAQLMLRHHVSQFQWIFHYMIITICGDNQP